MEGLSAVVRITPHGHVQERTVEQSVNVVVPPIMEGVSAVVQITSHEHVQGRIVEQSMYVVVPLIIEEITAVEQVTPRVAMRCANHSGSTEVGESSFAFIISIE